MIILTREAEQLFDEVADFSRQAVGTGSGRKFGAEDVAAQGFAAVGVRRASRGIVPRRSTAVAKGCIGFVPGPQFHQGMRPKVQMISSEVRPEVAKLLLAGSPYLLDVVEDLFDGRPIGERFQDIPHARLRVGREEELAAVAFLDDDYSDHAASRMVGGQEGLVLFGHRLAVLHALDGSPAASRGRPLGQADAAFAVGWRPPRSASLSFFWFSRQIVQGGVLSQPADDHHAQHSQGLEERPLGVSPVGHQPQPFSRLGNDHPRPKRQRRALLEFGLELPAQFLGQAGNVFPPDVERRPQGQANRTPQRMPRDPSQGDPNVPVKELGVGRSGSGIVMDACPLHFWPVAFGRRVVDCKENVVPTGQTLQQQQQQTGGKRFGLASHGGNEIIVVLDVAAHSGSPQPTGRGLTARGKEDAEKQNRQPPPAPSVQPGPQPFHPFRPFHRTFLYRHPWLSCL